MTTAAIQANAPINTLGDVLPHVPTSPRAEIVYWCQWSVLHQSRFRYTMGPDRHEMFDYFNLLTEGKRVIRADCSQFAAALLHHVGVKKVNNLDYTGTLLDKGTRVSPSKAKPGDVIIFGGGTGKHAAIKTYNGFCIGFGHWPGAPDRTKITDMSAWFLSHGYPGVRYLSFL